MSNVTIKPMSNEWKQWVATNLIQGVSTAKIRQALKENGFTEADIILELMTASKSPYVEAGKRFATNNNGGMSQQDVINLKRRDWLLSTQDMLARLDQSYNQNIDRIDTPKFDVFIKNYYSKHLPVVLQNGINHWQALDKWTPQYFAEKFGDKEVQIQFDRESDDKFELNSNSLRKNIKMSEYVEMIEKSESSNNFYMTANNTAQNIEAIKEAFNDLGDFGEGYRQLTNDPTFTTFFWMGPKGIFTPIHHDLTNNMLVQIYGSKKVTLIPANQVPFVYNTRHVFSDVDFPNVDLSKYPLVQNTTPVEVIISAGEALFIPIGWWHYVDGLEDSISISFTNFNAPNSFSAEFNAIK